MSKFLASLVLATSILAGVGAANAAPSNMGLQERAQSGQITPHGVFDAR